MTTCSTRRRFAAATRRWWPARGASRALAVGDLLFSRAFADLAEGGSRQQVELLSRASVALALGELAQRRDAFDGSISAERYLERCELKTGRLFECACVIGRLDGSGPPAPAVRTRWRRSRSSAREIGLAFQLLDDVLDVTGPPERTGKARGTDLLDGTVTLPLILARERDQRLAELNLRGLDAEGAEAVCDRIAATGVLDQVRAGARRRVELAKRALERSALDPDQRQLLELVADGVVERYS